MTDRSDDDMIIPLLTLAIVFVSIAYRKGKGSRLEIWQIMTIGALVVLLTGQISFSDALGSVNIDVILFLVGMFIIGAAMEMSGYLSHSSYRFFRIARTPDTLLFLILFVFGSLSAILMNDTLAIIGTPIVIEMAMAKGYDPKAMLIALAFAVTIGSVASPIGNPQNLMVALGADMANPFVTFAKYLALPTLINMAIAFLLLRKRFVARPPDGTVPVPTGAILDPGLATLSKVSLFCVVSLILLKVSLILVGGGEWIRLTYIPLISALPIMLFSKTRVRIARSVDWKTIAFFISMFVLMESVWLTGIVERSLTASQLNVGSMPVVFAVSTAMSQLISNVPLVAMYVPLLTALGASTKTFISLACGSSIAGNLTILGAASNIIIIQNAERRGVECFNFMEFARVGLPLTILNVVVCMLFISLVP